MNAHTKSEASVDGVNDPAGTSLSFDVPYHLVIMTYGMAVFGFMNIWAYVFFFNLFDLNDDDGFVCDLDAVVKSDYDGVSAITAVIKDRASCEENIMKIFKIMDRN